MNKNWNEIFESAHRRAAERDRDRMSAIHKETERQAAEQDHTELFAKFTKAENDRKRKEMEAQIAKETAEATAAIKAKYAAGGRAEWNESKTDRAFRSLLKGLNLNDSREE